VAVVEAGTSIDDADHRAFQHLLRIAHGARKSAAEIEGEVPVAVIGRIAREAALLLVIHGADPPLLMGKLGCRADPPQAVVLPYHKEKGLTLHGFFVISRPLFRQDAPT
jgi:hypothetical protein